MAATAAFCRHSDRAPAAVSRAIPDTSFGPSVWLRSLIQPPEGYGVAYIDWCQQEHGIAAVLSGESAMQAAYLSGDPYLEFAKQAGAVPADATKQSHQPHTRTVASSAPWPWPTEWRRKDAAAHWAAPNCIRDLLAPTMKPTGSFGRGRTRQ